MLGNLDGIKKSQIQKMERLYRRRLKGGQIVSYELAEELCELSLEIRREITLLMDFQGRVELVVVADADALDQVTAITLPAKTDGLARRYGLHSHLGWKEPTVGDHVTLLQFHFPLLLTLAAGVEEGFSRRFGEHPACCDGGWLLHPVQQPVANRRLSLERAVAVAGPMTARQLGQESLESWLDWAEPVYADSRRAYGTSGRERALLMGLHAGGAQAESVLEDSLGELSQLARTAGAEVVDRLWQMRKSPDPNSYLGSGKAEAAAVLVQQQGIDVAIADDELSPAQQRTLERLLRTKVIDRTELILDIFAQRAQSREGKIQVELAQLQYEMPRLKGRGRAFSQQTAVGAKGGIATRGPGETKLETDRRLLRERVAMLEREAAEVVRHRQFQRQSRRQSGRPLIALVGYTNAGKSTLMNRLTKADILAEDKLFATLDPTTRRLHLGAGQEVLLSDTVGFIRKLPTFLIKAFRATLEEVVTADLLWHVWDVSHPERMAQAQSVHEILESLWTDWEVTPPPLWTLCNKIDRVSPAELELILAGQAHAHPISAATGDGLPELLAASRDFLAARSQPQPAEPGFLPG